MWKFLIWDKTAQGLLRVARNFKFPDPSLLAYYTENQISLIVSSSTLQASGNRKPNTSDLNMENVSSLVARHIQGIHWIFWCRNVKRLHKIPNFFSEYLSIMLVILAYIFYDCRRLQELQANTLRNNKGTLSFLCRKILYQLMPQHASPMVPWTAYVHSIFIPNHSMEPVRKNQLPLKLRYSAPKAPVFYQPRQDKQQYLYQLPPYGD